ncbi:MAG: lysoplasmalogenase [Aquamicrobium sp.]|uniref:lysoplasmalogenase family protein n=1 Tax=Aquamicrobium sp. TaxID=1872579 RepID=UPI00349E6F9F|nr:lysoplasmalogenase [Aquamicrobium sp.]
MMPFAGGLDSLPNGTLLLSVAAALLYLPVQGRAPSLRRSVVKTTATALLAVLAFIEGGPFLLVAALALSAAGDFFLARDGETAFLAGLASFLAAHLAYVPLFLSVGGGMEILTWQLWRLGLVLLAAIGAALLMRRLLAAVAPQMRVPVAVYAAAILAMLLAAATVPSPVILIGAILFVLSDSLLAIGRFLTPPDSPRQRPIGAAVWVLYYLAQAAIALGFLL